MSQTGSLNTRAMTSDLSISYWTAKKFDKKVSREVAEQHQADETVGRYNKNLRPGKKGDPVPMCVSAYDRIVAAAGAARQKHYEQTLPWADDGPRVLLSANYMDYSKMMREQRREFENAVSDFLPQYPAFKEYSRAHLNGLYNEADFPSEEKIASKFKFKVLINPIPHKYDFRADLSEIEVKAIRQEMEEDQKDRVVRAMADPYKRLWNKVAHMRARLEDIACPCEECKGSKAKSDSFKNTLVENVRDLCALIPKLNLTNDPQLEAFRVEIETGLTSFEAKDLRKDPVLKKSIAERAAEIQQQMAGYCGVAA